jgi:hypothetical protein
MALLNTFAFVVADFTNQSKGVYFEVGYARGCNLPVVWTYQDKHIDDVHFDIRQYNCVKEEKNEDLRNQLHDRIIGSIGPRPMFKAQLFPADH